ncbi:MAG: hypothetical protein GW778_04750 [Alphaproteobacteria bacterium]|nr:hypothetical protein [Alphaproteobacteria bacterium]
MIGILEPIAALGLLTLASSNPSTICKMPGPAQIRVMPKTAPVKYDLTQTREQLQAYTIDTVSPYGFDTNSHTDGFMRGRIGMRPIVKLNYEYVYNNKAVCIWYENVELRIEIDPEIVIAKEVAEDPCQFKAVKEHELKHVMVDRKIVNKYAKTMGKKVHDGLKSRGFLVGPVPAKDAQNVINRMQQTVGQLVELEYKKMNIERAELQQGVDSLEEYQRVSAICEGEISASRGRNRR